MKLESKPDDICGNCGHAYKAHTICVCVSVPCSCERFVPPLVARLVEALEAATRASTSVPVTFDKHRLSYVYRHDHASFERDRAALDLLVELGRMEKDGEVYRWKDGAR